MNRPELAAARLARGVCALPFDVARAHHAAAVRAGLLPRSMLADREFERTLGAMEHWVLGPLARRV